MSKLWLCTTTAELCRNQWLKDGNWRCWLLTCTSSTSTLRKTRSVYFLLSSVKTGAIARHGPHQVAVKSTTSLNRIKKKPSTSSPYTLRTWNKETANLKKSLSSWSFTTLPWLLASSTLSFQVLLLLITMTLPWSPAITWDPAPDQIKSSQFDTLTHKISQTENRRPLDYNKGQTKLRNYDKEKVTILSHLRNCPSTNWENSETSAGHAYQKTLSWCDTNKHYSIKHKPLIIP